MKRFGTDSSRNENVKKQKKKLTSERLTNHRTHGALCIAAKIFGWLLERDWDVMDFIWRPYTDLLRSGADLLMTRVLLICSYVGYMVSVLAGSRELVCVKSATRVQVLPVKERERCSIQGKRARKSENLEKRFQCVGSLLIF